MNAAQCCPEPSEQYLTGPGNLCATLPCHAGQLRVGVFLDGTGNNIDRPSVRLSNVIKLARVYQIDSEEKSVRWIYARGVGTNSSMDFLGAAFGKGAAPRFNGVLHEFRNVLKEYEQANGALPGTIVMDVFGFSRGAAMARHFVNVVKQGMFTLPAPYNRIPASSYRIGFLGVFDTVASFGNPGDNIDRGFSFHIAEHWLQDGCLHLVANDEHRENFPLQALLDGQDPAHPVDMQSGRMREIVLPGAHSDIGGAYERTPEQSNELERITLRMMYEAASEEGVPVDKKYSASAEREETLWEHDANVSNAHQQLLQYYEEVPGLVGAHRRWRVLEVARDLCERRRRTRGAGSIDQQERHAERLRMESANIEQEQERRFEAIKACFPSEKEFNTFWNFAGEFQKTWVHRSHAPYHSSLVGMEAGRVELERRRRVYFNRPKDMQKSREFSRVQPKAYPGCVWVDRDCLKEFEGKMQ